MAGIEAGFINLLIAPKLVSDFAGSLGSDLEKKLNPVAEKAGKAFSEKLTEGLNKAGKGLTAGVTAPLLALGGTAVAVGLEIDGAFDGIRVQTGATGEALEGLKDDFRAVAADTTASFEEVGATIATLNTRLGLTGEPLQKLADQLLDIKQITGEAADVDQVTKFFNAFGIGADEQGAALDKLFVISQKTGIGFNELVSQTLGQTAAFETLGFSAIDAAAFVGKLESSGANTGAVLAGLNKAIAASVSGDKDAEKATKDLAKAQSVLQEKTLDLQVAELKLDEIRANPKAKTSDVLAAQNAVTKLKTEITTATQQIDASNKIISASTGGVAVATETFFQDTVKAIEGLIAAGDEAGAQNLAKDIFGAKGFTTVIKQIKDGTFNIQEFTQEVQNSTETINGLADETADFPEQLAKLKNQSKLALEPIANVLLPAIGDAFEAAAPIIKQFTDGFKSLSPETARTVVIIAGIAAAIGPALVAFSKVITAVKTITTVVKAMNLTILLNPWALAAAAAIAAIYLIIRNWGTIKEFFLELWDSIVVVAKAAFEGIAGIANGVVTAIINGWNSFTETTANIFNGIKDIISGAFDAAKNLAGGAIDFIKTNWLQIFAILTGPFGQAVVLITKNWGTIKQAVSTAIGAIKQTVSNIGDALAKPFRSAYDGIIRFFTNIKTSVTNTINAIIKAFQSLQASVSRAISNILKLPGFSTLAKVFGAVKTGLSIFGGALATGGPVDPGRAYLVGEQGPEIVVPNKSGYVLPNNVLSGLIGSQSNGSAAYTVNVYNPVAETSSASIPAALRRTNLLRSNA